MLTDEQRESLGEWLRTNCPFALTVKSGVGHGLANLALRVFGRDEAYSLCWLGAVDAMRTWEPARGPFHVLVTFRAAERLRVRLKKKRLPCRSIHTGTGHEGGVSELADVLPARPDDGPQQVDAADLRERLRDKAGDLAAAFDVLATGASSREAGPQLGCSHTTARNRFEKLRERLTA